MSAAPNHAASCGFADAIITLSGEDSASCQNNHHISSPHVRHQRVPDRITIRAFVLPDRISSVPCDGDSGWKTHHEVCERLHREGRLRLPDGVSYYDPSEGSE